MEKIELNSVNAQNIDTFYMTVDGYAILGILIELTLWIGHREWGGASCRVNEFINIKM